MSNTANKSWWMSRAKTTAFKVNLGWFLRWWLPWAVGASAVFSCAVLIAKRTGVETDQWWTWMIPALGIPAIVALIKLRKQGFSTTDALVRLEGELGLNNALSTAAANVTDWPAPKRKSDGLRWRFERILIPPAAAAILLSVAWRMPTQLPPATVSTATVEPVAWQQVDDALEQLNENETITPESIEEFREKLESLRDQPKDEWYSHASLEAGDELRDQLERNIREFADGLQLASQTVSEMGASQEESMEISARQLQALTAAMQQAMQQLSANGLGLDERFASQMKNLQNLDPSKLGNMSKEQLEQLRQALQNAASQCANSGMGGKCVDPNGSPGQGQCPGAGCDGDGQGNCQGSGNGQCPGNGSGATGIGPGRGGINRGPGAAPLSFKEAAERLNDQIEGASSKDFSRAGLGDNLGQSMSEHQVDRTKIVGPSSAGGGTAAGAGGETVWKSNLSPAERNALKKFYK